MQSPTTRFLRLSGAFSLFFGLFHVPFLFLGEIAARFFSAPPYVRTLIRENSPWLYLVVALVLALFCLFSAYAFAAARTRRLRLPDPLFTRNLAVLRALSEAGRSPESKA